MKRRILIHALGASMGGALRHLTNFLPELGHQDPVTCYRVLVRESLPDMLVCPNIELERMSESRAAGWRTRLAYDLIQLPRRLRRERFDAVVSLTNTGPIWSPVPHVLFQRNSLFYSNQYFSSVTGKRRGEIVLRRRLAVESMKRADLIVTPSDSMAEMIRHSCPQIRHRRYRTLYHGLAPSDADRRADPFCSIQPGCRRIKLLYPTHAAPHKGFEVLFKMLACLRQSRSDFTLYTTAAQEDWAVGFERLRSWVRSLGIEDHVVFTGRVPQLEMGRLYDRCDLMVYPSLCESFGFPLLESMGRGLPIVAADTPVNREICGGAAVFYAPHDPEGGAEAIRQALEPGVRTRLAASARERLTSFDWTWNRYVRQFREMIEEIV